MKTDKTTIYSMKLNDKQREEVRELTGKEAETLSLTVEELEARIAPALMTN
jgi:hypothetical protein